jgi:predicted DNA-binding transcriptional regulator YafY
LERQSNLSNKGKENMQKLMDACIKSREITFDHQKYGEKVPTERRVQPYQIRESGGMWYIIGIEPDKIGREPHEELVKFRAYGLDRISKLTIGYPFKRDKIEEFNDHYADVIGIVNGYNYQAGTKIDVETIRLKVDKESWNFIEAIPWHPSQKMVEEIDNHVVFELNVKPTSELERLILEWSPKVEVLAPPDLKKTIKAKLKTAMSLYS